MHKTELIQLPDSAAAASERGGMSDISELIYVNGCWEPPGCIVRTSANNDALQNISSIPDTPLDSINTISPFEHSEEVWDQTIQCLREVYGPYNVTIVDSLREPDPGALGMAHHEAILAGSSDEIGLPADVLGVANISCGGPINNVISFNFANAIGADFIDLCWTVAQESAHAYGLDHAFECLDPMTYLPNCGQKFFRNKNLPCGEFTERACMCGGSVQNSHEDLLAVFGEGTPVAPPSLAVPFPEDGAVLNTEQAVLYVESTDPRLVDRIELYINGWLTETRDGNSFGNTTDPYQFDLRDQPDSVLDIEIRSYNDLEIMASQTLTVTKNAPCSADDRCLAGQECSDGRCAYPTPTGLLGEVCTLQSECVSLLCPLDEATGEGYCSETCVASIADSCPEGFECLQASGQGVCWPLDTETGGCCSAGADRGPTPGQIALFLLCALALYRRRRPQRARKGRTTPT
ncbi:MAG: hypothetical protein AAGC55_07565 [Myxococcota bacterium]